MFSGWIKDERGNTLIELGPYLCINTLVEDLVDCAPEWSPDYEMTVWMTDNNGAAGL